MGDLMKQAQQMQAELKTAQDELATIEVTGESGGGMVRVTMTGRHDVRRVEVDLELVDGDKEILEDLVAAAVNDANRRVESLIQDKFAGIACGLGLPAGFKLPF